MDSHTLTLELPREAPAFDLTATRAVSPFLHPLGLNHCRPGALLVHPIKEMAT